MLQDLVHVQSKSYDIISYAEFPSDINVLSIVTNTINRSGTRM